MTPPLIGMIGRKRAGKDTFAAKLVDDFGYRRVAFADPLKATMLDLDPFVGTVPLPDDLAPTGPARLRDVVAAYGWERAKEIPEVRRLLQAHGVAIREHVDPLVWVDAAMAQVRAFREPDDPWAGTHPVVITDVRFPNEAHAIKAAGGSLVRVIRPGQDTSDQHVSETALDDWPADVTFHNDGTVAELQARAETFALLARM